MRNELELSGLDEFAQLEGSKFEDLPSELSNALQIRPYLRVVTLLKQSDPELKYEVFQRLNTGGERLNAQEIRNVAFYGPLTELIYRDLCQAPFLMQQLKIKEPVNRSPAYRKMQDAEFVLRFLTLREGWESFSGDLARSMDKFMEENQHPSEAQLGEFRSSFERALERCESLWGVHAFNRPEGTAWRDQTLAGMYDAEMIAVSRLSDRHFENLNRNQVLTATRELFNLPTFDTAVRQGTNTPSRVRFRIHTLTDALQALTE